MRLINLIEVLDMMGDAGISVFTLKMIESYFPGESRSLVTKSIDRALSHGVLERACRGVYVSRYFANEIHKLESIAAVLKPGEYSYVSLESALAEYSIISQQPMSTVTIMTTGRSQTYRTRWGTIEMTHTARSVTDILDGTVVQNGRPLRLARPLFALADLRRVNRNLHLVNEDILEEIKANES